MNPAFCAHDIKIYLLLAAAVIHPSFLNETIAIINIKEIYIVNWHICKHVS
jgi:hypothetical protein